MTLAKVGHAQHCKVCLQGLPSSEVEIDSSRYVTRLVLITIYTYGGLTDWLSYFIALDLSTCWNCWKLNRPSLIERIGENGYGNSRHVRFRFTAFAAKHDPRFCRRGTIWCWVQAQFLYVYFPGRMLGIWCPSHDHDIYRSVVPLNSEGWFLEAW